MMRDAGAVCAVGEALVVMIPEAAGRLQEVPRFSPQIAGAEFNTAVGLARLGVPASFAGAVGADPFGEKVLRAARAEGLETACIERPAGGQTGVFFKQWSGLAGDPSVFYYRSASAMATGLWDAAALCGRLADGDWRWLHTTGITGMVGPGARAAWLSALRAARAGGAAVSFDVNVRLKMAPAERWRELLAAALPLADWFLAGDGEARLLFGADDAAAVERMARESGFGGRGAIVKEGERGATASVAGELTHVDAWPVRRVVDTVGAGDGFNAGWIAGMLSGRPLADAMRLGALVGAHAVTAVGDYEAYPYREEVEALLDGTGAVDR